MERRRDRTWLLLAASMCVASVAGAAELDSPLGSTPRPPVRSLANRSPLRIARLDLGAVKTPIPSGQLPGYTERFALAPSPLLQRISSNVQGAGLAWPDDPQLQSDELTDNVKRGVIRATRRAVKRVLLDALDVDRLAPSSLGALGSVSVGPADTVRFRVGVSHMAPRVDMRYRLGEGALNVSVGARGQLGVDLDPPGLAQGRLHVGYDYPSRTYAFAFRLGF